ncbi:snaclec coagulation factor IX-binding protein subunit A-like [Emydura macquarii macquarii]|uniref:snaclec coagulation factor IX-binding protein subunit A-like n=1 Tax=Emydura macquarii macquarii TaxID=1129001 RepID=UPI00352AC6B9
MMTRCWLPGCLGPFLATLLVGATFPGAALGARFCPCAQGCCPTGWYQYRDSCYYPVEANRTWGEAESNCKDLVKGAHLVSVHSAEENIFIYHLMGAPHSTQSKGSYWLGGHRRLQGQKQDEGSWRWADGSAWDYNNFGTGKPGSITGESYVASWQLDQDSVTWINHANSTELMSVCKHPLD